MKQEWPFTLIHRFGSISSDAWFCSSLIFCSIQAIRLLKVAVGLIGSFSPSDKL